MPLVQCYEHPRHRRYYGLDEKLVYVQDLKSEAFNNLREKFLEHREPEIKGIISDSGIRSVLDIISAINTFKRDSFKSFGSRLSPNDFISAWRSHMFHEDLTIYSYLAGIGVANRSSRRGAFADISVDIEDLGFMWPLFGAGQLESDMFGKDTTVIICPPLSHEAFTSCGKLLIRTMNDSIVEWAKDVMDHLNVYRELEGEKPVDFFEDSEFISKYGKIRIY